MEDARSDPRLGRITALLRAWGSGEARALDELLPLVDHELRRLARGYMRRERAGHTLQPTALIHEALMRLAGGRPVAWQDRAHFYGITARLMRRVLVDHARSRGYQKRGGAARRIALDAELPDRTQALTLDVVALDLALEKLAVIDARKARVVELRFFGGLTMEEAACVLGVSTDTVKRDWRVARLWLFKALDGHPHD